MFGGNIDVQWAVFFVAVSQVLKLEAAFAVDELVRFVSIGFKFQFADFDFGRRDTAGRIDKCADLQIGHEIDQLVQLDVVINIFFPLQQDLSKVMLLLPKESLLSPSEVSDWKCRFSIETSPLSASLSCKDGAV